MKQKSTNVIASVGCVLLGISCISLYTDNTKLLLISSSVSTSRGSLYQTSSGKGAIACSSASHMTGGSVSIDAAHSDNDAVASNSTSPLHYYDQQQQDQQLQRPLVAPQLPLPPLSSSESDATTTLPYTFNNVDYTWIGNHWIPPVGVPTYTSKQIQDYFATRNTLWLGDSTCRRAFLTTHGIISGNNGEENDNVNDDTYTHSHHIPTSSIDGYSVVDINKQTFTLPFEQCDDREFYELNPYNTPETKDHQKLVRNRYEKYQSKENRNVYLCRNVVPTKTASGSLSSSSSAAAAAAARTTATNSNSSTTTTTTIPYVTKKGKFDYGNLNCGKELLEFVNIELNPKLEHVAIAKEYDLIIVAIGVWEVVRSQDCKMSIQELTNNLGPNGRSQQYPQSPLGHALASIDALNKLASKYKHLKIIWRTSGYVGDSFNYDKAAKNKNGGSTKTYKNDSTSQGTLRFIESLLFGNTNNNNNNNAKAPKNTNNLNLKDKNGQPSKGLQDLINLLDLDSAQQLIHESGIKSIDQMNKGAIEYINDNNNKDQQRDDHSRISHIDYGKVIKPRSFYPNRIVGDIDPHYGLEARTLLVQMLIHELYRGKSSTSSSRRGGDDDVGENNAISDNSSGPFTTTSKPTVAVVVASNSTAASNNMKGSRVVGGQYSNNNDKSHTIYKYDSISSGKSSSGGNNTQ